MNKWRPEGHDATKIMNEAISKSGTSWLLHGREQFFVEVGFDAALEALRKLWEEETTAQQKVAEMLGQSMTRGKFHYIAIPDDPEESV